MAELLKSLTVTLAQPALMAGATTTAKATATIESSDSLLDDNFPLAWSSSNPAVATVDATGLVKAVAAGTAVITATSGMVRGAATVTVAVPFVDITAVQEAAIKSFPLGSQFVLRCLATGGTLTVQVNS